MDRRQFMEVVTTSIAIALFPALPKAEAVQALTWGDRTLRDVPRGPYSMSYMINMRRILVWIKNAIFGIVERLPDGEFTMDKLLDITRLVLAEAQRIQIIHRSEAGYDQDGNIEITIAPLARTKHGLRLVFAFKPDEVIDEEAAS